MFCLCRFNFFSSLLQAATWQLWSLWIEQEYLLDCCSAFPFLIASPVSQGTGYGTLCANLMGIGSEFGFEEKTHLSPPKQSKNSPLWTNFAQDSLRAGWRLIWENSLHWKRKPDREELVFVIFSVHSRQKLLYNNLRHKLRSGTLMTTNELPFSNQISFALMRRCI